MHDPRQLVRWVLASVPLVGVAVWMLLPVDGPGQEVGGPQADGAQGPALQGGVVVPDDLAERDGSGVPAGTTGSIDVNSARPDDEWDLDRYAAALPAGDLTWDQVWPVMRAAYALDDDERSDLIERWSSLTVEADLWSNSDVEWNKHPEAHAVWIEYQPALSVMAADAFELLQDSLYRFGELGLHQRWEKGSAPPEEPDEWSESRGHYNESWTSSFRNWKMRVYFDSADFPPLEDLITEIVRAQSECRAEIERLVPELAGE